MSSRFPEFDIATLDFGKGNGMVIVIAQHAVTGAVLMVAHADRDAVARTVETGEMHYTSRTRGLWHKGATSGNVQRVLSLTADCDRDAILARVMPAGPACHTGDASCFSSSPDGDSLTDLDRVIAQRMTDPVKSSSYTRKLLDDRNLRLKKLGEETVEFTMAVMENDRDRIREEGADLMYHLLVAARAAGVTLDEIRQTLFERSSTPRP